MRRLLQHPNIDVNKADENNFTPLHRSCFNRRDKNLIELLKHPNIQVTAKETIQGRLPLHIACNEDNIDIVQMLLSHQQEQYKSVQLIATNYYKESPLHIACYCNRSGAVVKLLLENSVIIDINASDKSGSTPLHAACSKLYIEKGTVNIVRALLEQPSIMIFKKNKDGETPLDITKRRFDDPRYKDTKELYHEMIQLFENYCMKRRWQVYCFLIKNE